ncbi:MAG: three-Cys-motif partner protein TcmP [Chloroflexi bacterium]|nr:three-Cys-motif partner protein TcmP [Chloroflexota bacterium]
MNANDFFQITKEQSIIKANIVSKYFWAWAKVITPAAKKRRQRLAYIDLFAGPGRYEDGTVSTPLRILEQAVKDSDMRQMLVTLFNDADKDYSRSLEKAIQGLPGVENLKYPPRVFNHEVGQEIVKMFDEMHLVPTFFFVDPWGYKGLSLRLINSVLKNWGCDCVFFFNYTRINMGLENELVKEHMDALFGAERAAELRVRLSSMSPVERELTIVEEIMQALKEMGGEYVLPFTFKSSSGKRTSHHLIFVTKDFKGYEIMKDIMAKESTSFEQGVPSFEYSPASERQPMLFEFSRPLDALEEMLLNDFSGKQLTMREIYMQHSVDRPYLARHYKEVLKRLEGEGKIVAEPPASRRPKGTFADGVTVTFPPRRE